MTISVEQQIELTRAKLRLLEQTYADAQRNSKSSAHTPRADFALATWTHQPTEGRNRPTRSACENSSSGSLIQLPPHILGRETRAVAIFLSSSLYDGIEVWVKTKGQRPQIRVIKRKERGNRMAAVAIQRKVHVSTRIFKILPHRKHQSNQQAAAHKNYRESRMSRVPSRLLEELALTP